MNHIEQFLRHRHVGIVDAHPDDHLIHGHAITTAVQLDVPVSELTLTYGRESTINFRAPTEEEFVRQGKRIHEGERAAGVLGIINSQHIDLPDGGLSNAINASLSTYAIANWAQQQGIDTFITLGTLGDHDDHTASARAAQRAAALLAVQENIGIEVLELQADGKGEWVAPASPESTHRIYSAAAMHVSQFMLSRTVQPGWQRIAPGFSAHPHTVKGLSQYPIARHAVYSVTRFTLATHHTDTERPAYGILMK